MSEMKWFMINIKAPEEIPNREDLLLKIHAKVVFAFKNKLKSWHFLWEPKPFKRTLLVRFYGDVEIIKKLEEDIIHFLKREGVEQKVYGRYEGEAEKYGSKGWEYVMKILHFGSEFAVDLLEKERGTYTEEEFKRPLPANIERWVHLFMNQLSTGMYAYGLDEPSVLFHLSVLRTAVYRLGEEEYRRIEQKIIKEVPNLYRNFLNSSLYPLIEQIRRI